MFWKNTNGLHALPFSSKAGITLFLLIAGVGYLLGFLNILLSYAPVDQEPGLSVNDIRISFYGARDTTALEASIDGTMKEYFNSEKDYESVKEWIADGAAEADFEPISLIFEASSCNLCHSSDGQAAGVVTETYKDIEPTLAQDTGKSVSRLVSLSHTHVSATLAIIFGLAIIFSLTKFSEVIKTIVLSVSFCSILLDVGAWWLAKVSGALAPLVIVGGAALGLSYAVLVLLSLYDMWLRREA